MVSQEIVLKYTMLVVIDYIQQLGGENRYRNLPSCSHKTHFTGKKNFRREHVEQNDRTVFRENFKIFHLNSEKKYKNNNVWKKSRCYCKVFNDQVVHVSLSAARVRIKYVFVAFRFHIKCFFL